MPEQDRIAELEAQLAQARVRLNASRALQQEASERLQEANTEIERYRGLAATGADTIIALCEEAREVVPVKRQDLMLARHYLGQAMNTDAQDLAIRLGEILEEATSRDH